MNIYLHIDHSWSYKFLTKHKKIIADYDFFTFADRFITTAINFAMAHVNFRYNNSSMEFANGTSDVGRMCQDYPSLSCYLPSVFREFYLIHIHALNAIPGPIVNYQPINDDNYSLTGVLFTVDNRTL